MTVPETEISATMAAALAMAYDHEGRLERRAGGFWTWKGCPWNGRAPQEYFGTPTIEALVKRGRMAYVQFRPGRNGTFPIVAAIVEE